MEIHVDSDFAAKLIDIALNKGVDEAEVYIRTSKGLAVDVREQKTDTLESSITSGYCLRVIKDRRLGFSHSTNLQEINSVAEKAVESSKYTEPDEYAGLPEKTSVQNTGVPAIFDNAIASLSEEDAVNFALLIEKSAIDVDRRIKKTRKASASFGISETCILNSMGVNVRYSSTGCSAAITVIAENGSDSQTGWHYEGSRFLGDISFERVGKNAAKKALQLLGAEKASSMKGLIILENSIASEFIGILSSSLSSESVQKQKSMFAGKKGELVISRKLNIVDNGLLDRRLGSRPFDDEGVPAMSNTLVRNGILNGFLYNTYTARKDTVKSTGNAVRGGHSGLPLVGPTNLYLEPSAKEHSAGVDTLVKAVNRGIYVIETMGMHTANPITGEFSVGVSGLWIENGEIKHPVKEAAISGNILELFKNVSMVGDDLRFYGNIGASSLLIEGIDISA